MATQEFIVEGEIKDLRNGGKFSLKKHVGEVEADDGSQFNIGTSMGIGGTKLIITSADDPNFQIEADLRTLMGRMANALLNYKAGA